MYNTHLSPIESSVYYRLFLVVIARRSSGFCGAGVSKYSAYSTVTVREWVRTADWDSHFHFCLLTLRRTADWDSHPCLLTHIIRICSLKKNAVSFREHLSGNLALPVRFFRDSPFRANLDGSICANAIPNDPGN